jgi:branched-chain amino acid transport system ATP-binding protein
MLEVAGLEVRYGAIRAVRGISLSVGKGELVALLGANGAGKSSTLMCIAGALRAAQGNIRLAGEDVTAASPEAMVRRGVATVPEARNVFPDLTVAENLRLGAFLHDDKRSIAAMEARALDLFPALKERLTQVAGTLSGGEQQMLAIARALMSRPKFLMLDEPSLGIAPILVKTIFEKVVEINKTSGLTILLVEQNANLALEVSSYGYVLETGRVILEGPSADLKANPEVRAAYLGH